MTHRTSTTLIALVAVLLAALSLGCEQKNPETKTDNAPKAEGSASEGGEGHEGHEGHEMGAQTGDEAAPTAEAKLVHQPGAKVGDRTMCPVMGGEFEVTAESPSVEHDGQKVYFCCPGCDATFKEDPEGKLTELKGKIDAANAE